MNLEDIYVENRLKSLEKVNPEEIANKLALLEFEVIAFEKTSNKISEYLSNDSKLIMLISEMELNGEL